MIYVICMFMYLYESLCAADLPIFIELYGRTMAAVTKVVSKGDNLTGGMTLRELGQVFI